MNIFESARLERGPDPGFSRERGLVISARMGRDNPKPPLRRFKLSLYIQISAIIRFFF
ncbi:MAG: hypothetical protein K9G62_06930 [Alphaproteobacteria bacterium]|nr:hypothetical protein [Alphaproteobacteria bacterium]